MHYMILIYGEEASYTPERQAADLPQWMAFQQDVQSRGMLVSSAGLYPTSAATTLRVRDGKPLITDGPFAETKEQLGGFYVLDCKDLDEAIEIAAKLPNAATGTLEIRPVTQY